LSCKCRLSLSYLAVRLGFDFFSSMAEWKKIPKGIFPKKLKVYLGPNRSNLKKAFVETYKASQTFKAPLDFVFQWCTDFREDDGQMIGSNAKRTFLERTDKRVVWTVDYKEKGKQREGFRVVWLHAPDSWSLDTCGDKREIGEYKLTPKGKNKTRLDMKFWQTFDSKDDVTDQKKWQKDVDEEWGIFAENLVKDYKASLKA
jgi:hypothetical protein